MYCPLFFSIGLLASVFINPLAKGIIVLLKFLVIHALNSSLYISIALKHTNEFVSFLIVLLNVGSLTISLLHTFL